MYPHSREITNSIIFGWYVPMWLMMGAVSTAFVGMKAFNGTPGPQEDHTQSLIATNRKSWEDLIEHPLPRQMARGTAPLNGFRHYLIQDATYLEYYARVRIQAAANSRSGASLEDIESAAAKMSKHLKYAADMRSACEKLGVPKDVVAKESMSKPLRDSIDLYETVVRNGDWLAIHIVLLPCVMGYYTIASKLLADPATVRNTPYFKLWIEENGDGGTFERYKKLINDTINKLPEEERKWEYWNEIFGQACLTEWAFFNLAYEDFKYNVVSDGRYKIRSYGRDGVYLVPGESGRVLALQEDPEEYLTWELTNTRDGYSIRNIATDAPLGVSVTEQFPPYYEANNSGEGYMSWSLIPNSFSGIRTYHLFVSSKMQFALDVDISQSSSKVFVANGHGGASQMWLLEAVA